LVGTPFEGFAELFETSLLVGVDRHNQPNRLLWGEL
jgi:hypothetical protein